MLKNFNYTCIVLISKTDSPEYITQYRPISLYNVVYKIVAKVLANCLKTILPHIILDNQSTFVPGCLITDNVLVAFELMHFLKNKREGRDGYFALKIDMSKAYNRVEWTFLEKIMAQLGFSSTWIRLIMSCVSTVSYSVIFNGNQCGYFHPSKGLQQRDFSRLIFFYLLQRV